MKLDSKSVAALDLPTGKTDVIHFDGELKGFGYRLRAAAGGKVGTSWLVQYRRAGATRRLLLGPGNVLSAEAARAAAKKTLAMVALGEDPQEGKVERRNREQADPPRHHRRGVSGLETDQGPAVYLPRDRALPHRQLLQAAPFHVGRYHQPQGYRCSSRHHQPRKQ